MTRPAGSQEARELEAKEEEAKWDQMRAEQGASEDLMASFKKAAEDDERSRKLE